MRVAVIGAGVIGVTTAYELGIDGHEVTVYERHGSVAAEASFANAGIVAPSRVAPWAAPGMPARLFLHRLGRHAPVRFGGPLDTAMIGWLWHWWRACRPQTYRANRARMHRLAHLSRERLREHTQRLHLDFERAEGLLVLLRSARDLALAEPGLRILAELGVAPQLLDAAACRLVEPGLHPSTPLHAGIHTSDDMVGNCREFTHLLRKEAARHGVRFRFDARVASISAGATPSLVIARPRAGDAADGGSSARTGAGPRADGGAGAGSSDWPHTEPRDGNDGEAVFDAVVVCAALGARPLLQPLGVHLPIQPVYGFSVTAPLRHDEQHLHREPRAALVDEHHEVAISRLGNRVRVSGGAEIGGRSDHPGTGAQTTLDKVLDDWFPGVTQRSKAQRWKGARPMLPDGPPVLGASGVPGIWLNVGHGSCGWALACGSARLVADAVSQRPTPIELDGLGIERLR